MGIWIALAAVVGLLFVPLYCRIRIQGPMPLRAEVALLAGPILVWNWALTLQEDELKSQTKALILPAKEALPGFLKKKEKKTGKSSPFVPSWLLEQLAGEGRISWEDGFESLKVASLLQGLAGLVGQILREKDAKIQFRLQLCPPGQEGHFHLEAKLRLRTFATIQYSLRKAVRTWANTRSKN